MISTSRSSPTNTQTSVTNNQNLNLQDTAGITLANAEGINISTTDQGSLSLAGDITSQSFTLASDALTALDRAGTRGSDLFSSSLDFARDVFGNALEATSGVLREGQAQLGNTVTNLNNIARQQSTSTDERVQSIAKYALWAVVGLVGVLGLGAIVAKAKA